MSSTWIETKMNIFDAPEVGFRQPVRVSVGFEYTDDDLRHVLLCLWRPEGPLIGELCLSTSECLETVERLIDATVIRSGGPAAFFAQDEEE